MTQGIRHITPNEQGRQEKLDRWIRDENTSYAAIGRALGVSRNSAIKILKSESVRPDRADDLFALRINDKPIPKRLLPKKRKPAAVVSLERLAEV